MPDSSDKLYTARQVREQDYSAIHEFDIAGFELMKRAGRAVISDTVERYPDSRNWLVLCGSGNNGGDGYVVAVLAAELGIAVTVCSLADTAKLKGDAARAFGKWQDAGGRLTPWPLPDDGAYDLALDALLGTGIDRKVSGGYRHAIEFLNRLDCPRVAIDIPSGLNADTGCVMGSAVRASSSVTFVGKKRGMYTADGIDYCGDIRFDNLGIPAGCSENIKSFGSLVTLKYLSGKIPCRRHNTHKGSYGHVVGVGGIEGMSGAIRLCGEAALRSGAGRVTLATDPSHVSMINSGRPELMVRAVNNAADLHPLIDDNPVLAVGPGLGRSAWSKSLFKTCLATSVPLVLDADGLNLLALQGDCVARGNWILTPHPAEAGRLLECTVEDIQQDRVTAAQTIAERFDACVVLKGCGTVIASPGGHYSICALGNPGMATAGSGDVLTGIIAALLGQGLDCRQAAVAGVIAHAEAGDLAALAVGEMALVAGDIIDQLATVWMAAIRKHGSTR